MSKLSDSYKLICSIGSGSFGEVYMALGKDGKLYACKTEEITKNSRLHDEYIIYKKLKTSGIKFGIPNIYKFYKTTTYNILIMELLGKNLEQLFSNYSNYFDLGTVLKLGIDIIELLENIHNKGFIHRDIKPSNFLIGYENSDKIYIMDFGLSKEFMTNKKHINFKNSPLVGTARYTSINVHMGIEPTRRDDLESVGYMLIYFLKGKLPWQGIKKKKTEEQLEKIGEIKMSINISTLCSDLPDCFEKYINYCRDLDFNKKPDYTYLKKLFTTTAEDKNIKLKFIWC